MARVMATQRFIKDKEDFERKYVDFDSNLDEFLQFRLKARPDEPYGSKDSRLQGGNFKGLRRCHIVHGKALVLYELVGNEIRLIAVGPHDMVEGGAGAASLGTYARSLTADDYVRYPPEPKLERKTHMDDIDTRLPEAETTTTEQTEQTEQRQSGEQATAEPHQPSPAHQPSSEPSPIWNDRLIQIIGDRQMLYVPKPSDPMVVIFADKDLLIERGDAIAFDLQRNSLYHLTRREVDAHFNPFSKPVTTLHEAVEIALPHKTKSAPRATAPQPEQRQQQPPKAKPQPVVNDEEFEREPEETRPTRRPGVRRSNERLHDVGSQIGRLLVILDYLQRTKRTNKIETHQIVELADEHDKRSIPSALSVAQTRQYVHKVGPVPGGRGYYYQLTKVGERKAKLLGSWPFTVIGIKPPPDTPEPAPAMHKRYASAAE